MPNIRNLLPALLALVLAATGPMGFSQAEETDRHAALAEQLAPPPAAQALAQIPDPGRRLLALRSYVRAGSKLADRWSWTEDEIKAFQGSPEQAALLAEVAAVGAHFAEANPGFEIYANTKVRSLDVQIKRWNNNDSVGAAAAEILAAWQAKFGSDTESPGNLNSAKLQVWLAGFRNTERARLAAPGLTQHGRANAIDFQIMKDGQIIAGADLGQIEMVWRAEKWGEKLNASIVAAGPSFSGPLVSPDEPWHYNYTP
jgi:hypothetical protein